MNKPNEFHRHALIKAVSRPGRFHRALILGLLAASCGCTVTRQTTLLARERADKMIGEPKWGSDAQPQVHNVAAGNLKAAPRTARISDKSNAAATNNGSGEIVPVSYDEPLAIASDDSSILDPSCVQPGQAACGHKSGCQLQCRLRTGDALLGPMGEPVPQYWNDQEYLYDGGDRDPRVQVTEDWRV